MILSMIYPLTTIVVFIVHCYASSLAFDLIRKEIERCEIQIINGRNQDISFFLSVIKQKYLTACDAVDSINRTFGRMLLLSTTFFIVAVINIIYISFSVINGNMSFADKVLHFQQGNLVMKLTVWCFPQSENMIKELMRLKCADEPLKGNEMEQLQFLILNVSQNIPQINANGYFKISKRLLPQISGLFAIISFVHADE
uniref:Uncharacterized protein n=1 Tax=Daphnia galeata TaxID=27404 RepID=A0A8J2S751_9CRUS|nr:unnamed protein product [Daphnia galeata]